MAHGAWTSPRVLLQRDAAVSHPPPSCPATLAMGLLAMARRCRAGRQPSTRSSEGAATALLCSHRSVSAESADSGASEDTCAVGGYARARGPWRAASTVVLTSRSHSHTSASRPLLRYLSAVST